RRPPAPRADQRRGRSQSFGHLAAAGVGDRCEASRRTAEGDRPRARGEAATVPGPADRIAPVLKAMLRRRPAPAPAATAATELRPLLLADGSEVEVRWVRDPRARRFRLLVGDRGPRLTLPP